MTIVVQGTGDPLLLDPTDPAQIIGERINPSGKRLLRDALLGGDWEYIANEARLQVEAGAALIDVNVGGKGIDETLLLPEAVRAVSDAVDVPLVIDTRLPSALAAALAVCPGRPLVNSISGEREAIKKNLPIVADRGSPVIALCMGQEGIPSDPEARLKTASEVLEAAVRAGIQEEDVIFDPLVMTVGADDQAARVALETIRRLREEFPRSNITGGASNVSFGMPDRSSLNAHFLTVASVAGMNLPITDPTVPDLRLALFVADILLGRDLRTKRYMRYYRRMRS